ncbi:peptidoglycan-binding protein [Roseivivax halodurans JCM 10272]|uniref:Peptidoglycan-binding protein n=1 Tax=Roseivivax halodurans JCM 10272 TaxID=1449350 RepID=X7EE15_9RHOB|nr:peptidoglycan-binding domain-containing protein [Roseivivax halodurans]ETX14329.1 peptidoglycan-binding protein [Roseivivax halodurans JCM 10272]
MRPHHLPAVAAVLALFIAPLPAAANDAFVGGLVGGFIGSAINNAAQPKTRTVVRQAAPRQVVRKAAPAAKPAVSSFERTQNRETQEALNHFGFNAGTPDGILGSRSRSAISSYQSYLGYSPTGQLTTYERDFLVSSYHRAQAGGASTAQLVASNAEGVRGLLKAYRDEQTNGTGGTATAAIGGHFGLPTVIADAVHEIAKSSDPTAEQLVNRSGFMQLADINGDGRTDYIIDTSVTGSAFWCNARDCAVRVFASTPDGYERNDFQAFNVTPAMFSCTRGTCSKTGDSAPQLAGPLVGPGQPGLPQTQLAATTPAPLAPAPAAAAPVQAALPSFAAAAPAIPTFGTAAGGESLSSECNRINLLATTEAGYTTAETMTDASAALGEQLCLARTYAITAGEGLMDKVAGVSKAQISEQCAGFAPLLAPHVAALSVKPRQEVVADMKAFVLGSGMAPAQLETTARICLASGYLEDDLDVAVGSALLLVALGREPYGEFVGHHLALGRGTAARGDFAAAWYGPALTALDTGAPALVAPGQPERRALLKKASLQLGGAAPAAAPVQASALPVFSVSE